MSIIICPHCEREIDTDFNSEHEEECELNPDNEEIKNTDPRFFEKWDRDELNFEASRLNRLLEDIKKIISKADNEDNN